MYMYNIVTNNIFFQQNRIAKSKKSKKVEKFFLGEGNGGWNFKKNVYPLNWLFD